jgi:hypothetical protein
MPTDLRVASEGKRKAAQAQARTTILLVFVIVIITLAMLLLLIEKALIELIARLAPLVSSFL